MEKADKKQRGTLSGQVRHYILTKILSGDFEPGERLIEMKIARQMQTSQAPVREAIRELESTGLVRNITQSWLQNTKNKQSGIIGYLRCPCPA